MTAEAFESIQKGSCAADCEPRVGRAPLAGNATGFYWRAGEWSDCSALCGGGLQRREVECREVSTGRRVANDNCPAERLADTAPCNQVPCELRALQLSVAEGEPEQCSAPCGGGIKEKPMLCASEDGFLAPPGMCPGFTGAAALIPCGMQDCPATRWEVGPWSRCNATCGGGYMHREVRCLAADNSEVGRSFCSGEEPSERRCNTHLCEPGAWNIKPWGVCQRGRRDPCGVGTQARTGFATCSSSKSIWASNYRCQTPAAAQSVSCRTGEVCPSCGHDCHGRGECLGGECACRAGWGGQFCEVPEATCPNGLLDKQGNCCPSGTVDAAGRCCSSYRATLDRSGVCCESGKLDAQGVCDGSSVYADISGRGCKGIPDAAGFCCEEGSVDECGVCNGFGDSCALEVTVVLLVDAPQSGSNTADAVFKNFIAAILGINSGQVSIASLEQFSRVSGLVLEEGFRLKIRATPVQGALGAGVPNTGWASQRLRTSEGEKVLGGGLFLAETLRVARAPICGNGICEIAERPIVGSAGSKTECKEDCFHEYMPCPTAAGIDRDTVCSGRGVCFATTGQCSCFKGHYGAVCEKCIPGWVMRNGTCVFQSPAKGEGAAEGAQTASLASILISVLAGAGVSAIAIVGFTVIAKRLKRKYSANEVAQDPDAGAPSACPDSEGTPSSTAPHQNSSAGAAHPAGSNQCTTSMRALESLVHNANLGASKASPFNISSRACSSSLHSACSRDHALLQSPLERGAHPSSSVFPASPPSRQTDRQVQSVNTISPHHLPDEDAAAPREGKGGAAPAPGDADQGEEASTSAVPEDAPSPPEGDDSKGKQTELPAAHWILGHKTKKLLYKQPRSQFSAKGQGMTSPTPSGIHKTPSATSVGRHARGARSPLGDRSRNRDADDLSEGQLSPSEEAESPDRGAWD